MVVHTSSRTSTPFGGWAPWLGSSEMATLVRAFDWAQTPLGPIEAWPQTLKSAVAICLRSPFQMAIYWGPELTCIYNDAERDVLGHLHPAALGLPAREQLRDSWPIVGPQMQAVIEQGTGILLEDQPLAFDRRRRLEVSYFTYSLSPILANDDDDIGGVLLITEDTTKRVLVARRSETMRELTARSLDAPTPARACLLSADALTSGQDVPFAIVYLIDDGGTRARCVAARASTSTLETTRVVVALDAPSDEVSSLFRTLAAGRDHGALVPSALFVAGGQGWEMPGEAFVAPVAGGVTDPVDGYLVAGIREDLVFDEGYENFLQMAAVAIGRSVAAARGREAQRRRVSDIAAIDREKTALFSNASHELRTPLTLILGNLEQLLDEELLPGRSRDTIQVAHRSALRMLRLVDGLLDFSRLEAGESIGTPQETDVARLTAEVAAMFRSTAERAGLELIVDCPPLPAPVRVDHEAWERIVSNLISNALKFTPEGVIHVRARPEDGQLCLTVEDTGLGIAPEDLDHVFSRFHRSPDPRPRTHEGAGLGLALVRQLTLIHGGSIEAQSRLGEGTRMIVRLPLARTQHQSGAGEQAVLGPEARQSASLFVREAEGWLPHDGPRAAARIQSAENALDSRPIEQTLAPNRPRVLVAEDNPDMREYLHRLLAPHYSVALAPDGSTVWELALRDPPSLVISDVMMPGLDGFGLIRELRRDDRTRDVPVILLSARADPDSTLRALDLGADDYIIKPFGAPELLARVHATLQNARARTDAAAARGKLQERERHEGELRALLTDLRAAQRRVAEAGDAERRRVERDLHDGAQQRLMAIRLELGLVRELLDHNPRAAGQRLDELHHELDAAVEQLRELAHGLYPPLLASDGLYAALVAVARHSATAVTVDGDDMTRAPRPIESAAYFCCLEALQNATKHAGPGANVSIHLSMTGNALNFRVSDDGAGFDPDAVRPGYGLINLRDRIDALGGHVEVTSAPGRGTTVEGRIPVL